MEIRQYGLRRKEKSQVRLLGPPGVNSLLYVKGHKDRMAGIVWCASMLFPPTIFLQIVLSVYMFTYLGGEAMTKTVIKGCVCSNEYQDKKYGKQQRVMNTCTKVVGTYRCTVCGRIGR